MTTPGAEIGLGALLVKVHRHAWRADAPPLDLELAEVVALLPNLVKSGSVGLVWPRLRHRAGEYGAAGLALESAYRAQVEHNATVEREIARVVGHLQEHGIDPVLIKGWAVSRLYPEGIVRPAGDIDLVVPDADYERAKGLLAGGSLSLHGDAVGRVYGSGDALPEHGGDLDLHIPTTWADYPGAGFFEHPQPSVADGVKVHVPAAEEHIRALCFHFLRHGGARALRLCDIAMLFETRCDDFDWDRLLRGSDREKERVLVTLGLANQLLGASIDETPIADGAARLPGWLEPEVVRQWERPHGVPGQVMAEVLSNPRAIVSTFTRRWPEPITATVRTGFPFNDVPRLPVQWAAFVKQVVSYGTTRLPRQATAHLRR